MAEPFRDRSKFRTFCGFLFIYSSNEILLCLRRERTPPPDPGFLNDEHGDFTRRLCSCCIFFCGSPTLLNRRIDTLCFAPLFFASPLAPFPNRNESGDLMRRRPRFEFFLLSFRSSRRRIECTPGTRKAAPLKFFLEVAAGGGGFSHGRSLLRLCRN
jgi:hypothetical protein